MKRTTRVINQNDNLILGFFVGAIVILLALALAASIINQSIEEFIKITSRMLPIILSIYGISKVLKWYEVKKNEKGFSIAESIVMDTYSAVLIVTTHNRHIGAIDSKGYRGDGNYFFDKIKKDNELLKEIIERISINDRSLNKWNVKEKHNHNIPTLVNDLFVIQYQMLELYVRLRHVDHKMKNDFINASTKLNDAMAIYNELTIDELYQFNY